MQSLNRNLQQTLRNLHLWVGLIAGLFIVIMGISGVIVVFRPYFEGLNSPKVTSSRGSASLTLTAQNLAAFHSGARINRVSFPESPTEPLLVQAETPDKQRLQVFVDPASGEVLGLKKKLAWLDWTVELHQNLLLGKTGRALTGVIGVALLLLSVSGLVSWLAGRRNWKRTLALPQKGPWRRVNYDGHKWTGLWANLLLVIVSFTGIVLAYPDTFRQAIRAATGEPQPSPPLVPAGTSQDLRPLDEYLRAAAASIPGGVVRELRLPSSGRPIVSITIWAPGDARPRGGNVVYLDPSSANVLSVERSAPWSSKKLVDFANAIHKTEVGGLPLRLVFSLAGLASVLLCLSGVQIWWHRRQTRLRSLRVHAEEPAVPAGALAHK